jgi:hypothetical protein
MLVETLGKKNYEEPDFMSRQINTTLTHKDWNAIYE